MLLRSLQLTLEGPDPASPEGQKRIAEKGPASIRGLFNLLGRKLDLVAEFEDRVPAYVEQMFDRLEASGHHRRLGPRRLGDLDHHDRPRHPDRARRPEARGATAGRPRSADEGMADSVRPASPARCPVDFGFFGLGVVDQAVERAVVLAALAAGLAAVLPLPGVGLGGELGLLGVLLGVVVELVAAAGAADGVGLALVA